MSQDQPNPTTRPAGQTVYPCPFGPSECALPGANCECERVLRENGLDIQLWRSGRLAPGDYQVSDGAITGIEGRDPDAPDFHCHKCGAETPTAPDPPGRAVCEACCEDHDYQYERGAGHRCIHCDAERPADWGVYDD